MINELEMEFHDIINSYMVQIDQVGIIKKLAVKYLYDFPEKLPDEIKESIELDRDIVLKELEKSGNLVNNFSSGYEGVLYMAQHPEEIKVGELNDPISFPIVKLQKNKIDYESTYKKTNVEFFDFEYSINSQAILMFNAILEGFLKQIIQFIFKIDTDIKRRNISTNFTKRLEFLQEKCGIDQMDNPYFIKILRMLEQLRHIIVHNNGIADKEFVEKTGIENQTIGVRVKLHKDLLNIVGVVMSTFVIDLFQKIHNKYFKKSKKIQI